LSACVKFAQKEDEKPEIEKKGHRAEKRCHQIGLKNWAQAQGKMHKNITEHRKERIARGMSNAQSAYYCRKLSAVDKTDRGAHRSDVGEESNQAYKSAGRIFKQGSVDFQYAGAIL